MPPQHSTAGVTEPRTFVPPTHREILTILGGLMLGMFLAALDQTIVATSIRTIGDDLHGLSLQAWVTTAYLLTATISTPLYGKLSDIYGRKPLYLISISIFVVGSLLAGTADSMYQLAVYRGVQGLGAGGLMALAITILGDLVAPRERARYQGYFLAVFGTRVGARSRGRRVLRGAETILGITGWRWVFLINVPIGILAIIVVARVLHLPPLKRVDHKIDYPGALALVVALVPLLVVAEQGRIWGWDSPRSIGCYVVGVLGVAAFILAERYAKADAHPAAVPVPQPHVLRGRRRQHRDRPGHVRWPGDAPAVPADREGPVPDRGRPVAHPVHAGHHDGLRSSLARRPRAPAATRRSR